MFARLEASAFGGEIRIECFRGSEQLCRPYRFDIQLTVIGNPDVDMSTVVGSSAKLILARDDDDPQTFQGILHSVRLLVQTADWTLYEATLVPRVWRLGLTKHSNVFTKVSAPDLIKQLLEEGDLAGDDFELRVGPHYQPEELIVQYRESNLDFIHRWMEHEGMYYFFEQTDRGEKLVIVDDKSAHDASNKRSVRYHPLMEDDTSASACFDTFTVHHATTVKTVRVADYDYDRPALDVSAVGDVSPNGFGERVLHRSRFFDPEVAKHYAGLRAEELKSQEVVQHAAGTQLHMTAGAVAALTHHPNDRLNIDYVVTEVNHFCNQLPQERSKVLGRYLKPTYPEVYRVEVTTLDAAVQYRPPRATRRPRIWGYEAGVVDGEADSPYAQIDPQGRYLVKFHFDESDLDSGKASTFVRMAQPHGGGTEGFHFPLRKGTEVIFSFMGGDPDRPVITGVVPNATTPSPVNEGNHTQNVIRTGSDNHIVLDDSAGNEFISIQTPKDSTGLYMGNARGAKRTAFDGEGVLGELCDGSILLYTDQNTAFLIGANQGVEVGGFLREDVKGVVTETYKGMHSTTISEGGRYHKVAGTVEEYYDFGWYTEVNGQGRIEMVNGGLMDETYKAGQTTVITGQRKLSASGGEKREITGLFHVDATTEAKVTAPTITITGDNITITGTASVTVDTPKWDQKDSTKSEFAASFDIQGSKKTEIVGLAVGAAGMKAETWGMKVESKGIFRESNGVDMKAEGFKNDKSALRTIIDGFTSMT